MDRLVLWDIDRTLVKIPGGAALLYAAALRATTGRELEHMPDPGGKTDRELVTAVLDLHGIRMDASTMGTFFGELAAAALLHGDELRARGVALPGALEALKSLAALPGVVQTVVTGNLASIAAQKLALFGMDEFIDLEVGGYGSESTDRADLVTLCRARAERRYGDGIAGEHVVVVGDTPHDIAGALESGVTAVGVATGNSSEQELRAAGAHVVLASLADTAAVLAAITGQVGRVRPAG